MELAKVPLQCTITIFLVIAIIASCTFNNLDNIQGRLSNMSGGHKSVLLWNQSQQYTDNNVDDDGTPRRIAWLMSFPNSGTTYTKHLVHTVSGYNTASNYGNYDEARWIRPYKDTLQLLLFLVVQIKSILNSCPV